MKRKEIMQAALEAGIVITTSYGQSINQYAVYSDVLTLEKFARCLLNIKKKPECNCDGCYQSRKP